MGRACYILGAHTYTKAEVDDRSIEVCVVPNDMHRWHIRGKQEPIGDGMPRCQGTAATLV